MLYSFIGLFGLAAILAFNAGAVLFGRWMVAPYLGLPARPFWPFPASRSGPPIAAWKRALLVGAGFATAYVLAACLHAVGLHLQGVIVSDPHEMSARVNPVPGSVAALAGALPGDEILTVAKEPTSTWEELKSTVKRHAGQTVAFDIQRGTERLAVTMTISPEGRVGVTPVPETRPVGVSAALAYGFAAPLTSVRGVARAGSGDQPELSGPVALVAESATLERRYNGLVLLAMLNGAYGLLFALVFSIILGLRRAPKPTSQDSPRG